MEPTKYEKDDVVQTVKERTKLSREFVTPYFDRFLDNYKHYFIRTIDEAIEADKDSYPFYSSLMLPISFQVVETILPRMLSRIPTFSIQTEFDNDENDEKKLADLIRYQMNHPYLADDPIFARLSTGLKEQLITGNAFYTVPWVKKEVEVEEWQPYLPQLGHNEPKWELLDIAKKYGVKPEWKLVKTKKAVIDAPVLQHENIFTFLPDPKAKNVSDMSYGIFERMLTLSEIEDMINASPDDYINKEVLKDLKAYKLGENSLGQDRAGSSYIAELANIFGSTDYSTRDNSKGQGKYLVQEMREVDGLYIVVNEQLCIRASGNPHGDGKLGIIHAKDIPVPHQFYAWGEIDPIKKIEDQMSDLSNMRFDAVLHAVLKMYQVVPSALAEGEEFAAEPGNVIQVKELNGAIAPIETGNIDFSAYREYEEWEKIIQNVTGATDYATGSADESMNKTMGGVELLQQAANARFQFKLRLFEELTLKQIGSLYVSRNMRYFDTVQTVNDGEKKVRIEPEAIRRLRGNVNFIVDSGSTDSASKRMTLYKWQTVVGMLDKPPFVGLNQEALDEIGVNFLTAMDIPNARQLMAKKVQPQMPGAPMPQPGVSGQQVPNAQQLQNLPQEVPNPELPIAPAGAGGAMASQ